MKQAHIDRRSFLGMLGSASAATVAGPLGHPLLTAQPAEGSLRHLFVASHGGSRDGIHVFGVRSGVAHPVQFVPSPRPSSLLVSKDGQTLYVANQIRRFRNRPTGSVEAYRIDQRLGTLTLLGRQALALSATEPSHLSATADGRHLLVCVPGGGSYNVLPLAEDGSVGPVSVLRKETGCGPDTRAQGSAQPTHAIHDGRGRIISSDFGADRVSVFELRDAHLWPVHREAMPPGSGPTTLALDEVSDRLFVLHELSGRLAMYDYNIDTGALSEGASSVNAAPAETQAVSMHLVDGGNMLLSAWRGRKRSGLMAWAVDRESGTLRQTDEVRIADEIAGLKSVGTGNTLLAMNRTTGALHTFRIQSETRTLEPTGALAYVPAPGAVAWL